jgi:hypothetical protein
LKAGQSSFQMVTALDIFWPQFGVIHLE